MTSTSDSHTTDTSTDSSEAKALLNADQQTHFGFQQVPVAEKASKVASVFHSVSQRYDVMNDLMSFGIHRLWKRYTVELSAVKKGQKVLDLAGGTGDLAQKFSRLVGPTGNVVLADINASMLSVGRDRLTDSGCIANINIIQADAQFLPFPDAHFDCVTIAFGLRNVTDKDIALRAIYRVLKPGGRLLVLEFSKPTNPLLDRLYNTYSFKLLPKIGKWVANDEDSYRYLAESIRMHPDQLTLQTMMENSGFSECKYHNMTGGIVALHKGIKL